MIVGLQIISSSSISLAASLSILSLTVSASYREKSFLLEGAYFGIRISQLAQDFPCVRPGGNPGHPVFLGRLRKCDGVGDLPDRPSRREIDIDHEAPLTGMITPQGLGEGQDRLHAGIYPLEYLRPFVTRLRPDDLPYLFLDLPDIRW